MSRSQERQGIDEPTRVRLLETDLDAVEQKMAHDKNTLKTELVALKVDMQARMSELAKEAHDGFRECSKENESLRRLLMGLLLTIAASSVTIVATVLITAGSVS